jgi:hypothetical protein
MAQSDDLIPQQVETPEEEPQALNQQEVGSDSPIETQEEVPQQQPDYDGRIRALEERYQRAEQRNQYLEQTSRLLAEEREQYRRQQQQPQRQELPQELEDLGKTLDPLFSRRLEGVTKPMVDTLSKIYDEQDSARFEMYLMRNHPEVFEEEGGLDKIFQEVEAVRRQAAQSYNQWLSRQDAFLYAQGIHGVQNQIKTRKEKKGSQAKEEAKRLQSVKAATSGTTAVAPKRTPNVEIQSIREKAARGQKLTPSEREKYREFISGVSF